MKRTIFKLSFLKLSNRFAGDVFEDDCYAQENRSADMVKNNKPFYAGSTNKNRSNLMNNAAQNMDVRRRMCLRKLHQIIYLSVI